MEYSKTMDDIKDNIHDYNPNRNLKILIDFDNMIAEHHKKISVHSQETIY